MGTMSYRKWLVGKCMPPGALLVNWHQQVISITILGTYVQACTHTQSDGIIQDTSRTDLWVQQAYQPSQQACFALWFPAPHFPSHQLSGIPTPTAA